jgi:hypothetical protein
MVNLAYSLVETAKVRNPSYSSIFLWNNEGSSNPFASPTWFKYSYLNEAIELILEDLEVLMRHWVYA